MPFKSKKQKTYLAINEPEVYKKFKKEENMYGNKMMKRPMGGKVYKNTVNRPMGGKVYKVDKKSKGGKIDNSGQNFVAKLYKLLNPSAAKTSLSPNTHLRNLEGNKYFKNKE